MSEPSNPTLGQLLILRRLAAGAVIRDDRMYGKDGRVGCGLREGAAERLWQQGWVAEIEGDEEALTITTAGREALRRGEELDG